MAQNTAADVRTGDMTTEMAQWFAEERAEYEESDGYTIVDEDAERVVVADHTGHAINEWASEYDVGREALRATFRALAEGTIGEAEAHEWFSHADPVVFAQVED